MTGGGSDILSRAEARLGTVLRGKYRLDRILGIGGMAVVYKATHRNLAEFAVKMLHPEVSLSADIRSRFLREGYAANSIKHPGAVLVVDDDVSEDGAAFLVMELIDGIGCEDLWEKHDRKLSPTIASAILVQLLDVLAAAHEKGVVHRDIKPANLFITRTGNVKVLDFGIARAREALATNAKATGTGMMLGTPAFMAPEQAKGKSKEIDGRTDIWAAGATFFTLVSGQLVHAAETAHELLIEAATAPARSLATATPDVSTAIVALIDRALASSMEDRWASASAMRDALLALRPFGSGRPEDVLAAVVPGSARPPPTVARTIDSGGVPQLPRAPAVTPKSAMPLTTSSPMSSDRDPTVPVSSSLRWMVGSGVALATLTLAVAGWFQWSKAHSHPSVPEPATSVGVVIDAVPSSDTRASAPASSAVPSVAFVDLPVVDAGHDGGPHVATPPPPPPPAPIRHHREASQAPPPNHDCDQNFTLDEQGQKHWKPQCFLNKPSP
jgi:serine/threonine protein kinase